MLVLGRNRNESIIIGAGDDAVTVMVCDIRADKVRIGIEAPDGVPILRTEVRDRIVAEGGPDLLERRQLLDAVGTAFERLRELSMRLGPSNEAINRSLATDLTLLAQQLSAEG